LRKVVQKRPHRMAWEQKEPSLDGEPFMEALRLNCKNFSVPDPLFSNGLLSLRGTSTQKLLLGFVRILPIKFVRIKGPDSCIGRSCFHSEESSHIERSGDIEQPRWAAIMLNEGEPFDKTVVLGKVVQVMMGSALELP